MTFLLDTHFATLTPVSSASFLPPPHPSFFCTSFSGGVVFSGGVSFFFLSRLCFSLSSSSFFCFSAFSAVSFHASRRGFSTAEWIFVPWFFTLLPLSTCSSSSSSFLLLFLCQYRLNPSDAGFALSAVRLHSEECFSFISLPPPGIAVYGLVMIVPWAFFCGELRTAPCLSGNRFRLLVFWGECS